MRSQLSLPIAPVTRRVYQPRGINALQILFQKHFQRIAEQCESKYAVVYGRFRIEPHNSGWEFHSLCGLFQGCRSHPVHQSRLQV
jgi:hypothetical protein